MKAKVYVVSKTHLDLGYTDTAQNVLDRYLREYIPKSISIAKEINTDKKKFIWTLGSWLIEKGLEDKNVERANALYEACMRGDIVAHAMPFTVQSELMDERLANDALKKIKELDRKFGRKTVAAKMTDVPGHTIGLVRILADNGIKLLHIGVNKSSAVPCVPQCFLWRCEGRELIVIYEGSYGGVVKTPYVDDILLFDHSMDNCGPRSTKRVLKNFDRIKRKYRGYDVVAGTLDMYAEKLWEVKERLPVIEDEIGDTWIHGAASDPYKYGALVALQKWREKAVKENRLDTSSREYDEFEDCLLCVAEHTSGLGILKGLRDYDNYVRKDFEEALEKDRRIPRYGLAALPCFKKIAERCARQGAYSATERSWQEQRDYLDRAVSVLPPALKDEAQGILDALRPAKKTFREEKPFDSQREYSFGEWRVRFNNGGAPFSLSCGDKELMTENGLALVDYVSLSPEEFTYWLRHYQRDLYKNFTWAIPDFGRPKLKKADYAKGRFAYRVKSVFDVEDGIGFRLKSDITACSTLGMPEEGEAVYRFGRKEMTIGFRWYGKNANRLPEEIWLHLPFKTDCESLIYKKLGTYVSPYSIVRNGGKNLSVVEEVRFKCNDTPLKVVCNQCAPVSQGRGKLLKFDNKTGDGYEGISYLLYNNVWGTNYPLWYRDNAAFEWNVYIG